MTALVSIVLLCLCFLEVWTFTSANFVFQFKLSSVITSGDCRLIGDSREECDTYVTFCLRGRRRRTATRNTNDCPLGSSEKIDAHPLEGIQRRSIMTQKRWPGGFQMYVKAMDEDLFVDDDLDDIFINRALGVSSVFTNVMSYSGNNNKVTVTMSFRVMCQNNYYGSDCKTFCTAQDDDDNGHYICNSDGSTLCREGFEDPSNNCKYRIINPCDSNPCANNSTCTQLGSFNYTCQCVSGYSGSNCSECKPGFEKEGDMCTRRLPPTVQTDIPTTTTSHPDKALSGGNVATEGNKRTIATAVAVTVAVLILGVIIIVVLAIVIIKLKRKKYYSRHQEGKILNLKKSGMIVSPEKMFDNPMYNSTEFTTSYHSCKSPQPEQRVPHQDGAIYETPTLYEDAATHVVNNPVYGDCTDNSNDYEENHYVKNPIYGDPTDGGEQLYIIPQPLDAQTPASTGIEKDGLRATSDKEAAAKERDVSVGFHTYAIVDKSKKNKKKHIE